MSERLLPVLAEASPPAQDWTRRFMAAGPRVEESVTLYQALGFEVRLEPPGDEDLREECGDCRLALQMFRVLYTRRHV